MLVGNQAVAMHLSAFLGRHGRYIIQARYYLRENPYILLDSLRRADRFVEPVAAAAIWQDD